VCGHLHLPQTQGGSNGSLKGSNEQLVKPQYSVDSNLITSMFTFLYSISSPTARLPPFSLLLLSVAAGLKKLVVFRWCFP